MNPRMELKTARGGRLRKGFTLLEMITVVAITSILLGLGVPGYLRVKRQARAQLCAGNLRHLGAALNLYLGDHNLRMPTLAMGREDKNDDSLATLDTELLEYADSDESFRCPSDYDGLWEKTGSSYFWNSLVNGQMMGNIKFMGLSNNQTGIPLISDKENFHKHVGHEVNILYADGRVVAELQFSVQP